MRRLGGRRPIITAPSSVPAGQDDAEELDPYTLIRLDDDHFAYLVPFGVPREPLEGMIRSFEEWWPGKRLIVMRAGTFRDLTGQYEIVPRLRPSGQAKLDA